VTRQLDLFGSPIPGQGARHEFPSPAPEAQCHADLARRLPPGFYLGTSSWSFPGWRGLVYAGSHDASMLSQHGLSAYASHPLLRAVSIDRTYYAPMDRSGFQRLASEVPPGFRFMVKAPAECTTPYVRHAEGLATAANERFLDPGFALERFVLPALEGLGPACGVLLFQFPPQGRWRAGDGPRFASRLAAFLEALPRGPLYAVELRDAPLLTDAYADVLREHGVRHCLGVHPKAGPLARQLEVMDATGPGPVVARWNLNPALRYEDAKQRYAPFNRLCEEDPGTRAALAEVCAAALGAGQAVHVVANNKAEGCAPLTILELAREIVARS